MAPKIPGFTGEQEALTRGAVRDLLLVSLAWNLIRAAALPLAHTPLRPALLLLASQSIFVIAIPFLLWKRGSSRAAAWWMAVSASLLSALYVLVSGGLRGSAPFAQIAIVLVATIVLGRKGALWIGIPVLAFLAGVATYQAFGGQVPVLTPQAYWISLINVLAAGSIAFAPIPRALRTLRRTSAKLQTSNLRLESLIQSIEGIVWERNTKTWSFTFISGQAERILGYPARSWIEDSNFWLEHIHPDDRNWALAHRKSASADGKDLTCEYRMRASDGRIVWLRDVVSAVAENGSVLRGMLVDVTRLHNAENALHNRERCLEMTEAGGALGIWEYNLQTGESGFNGEWRRMFGFGDCTARISRDDCFARIHPEDRERIELETQVAIAWDGRFDSQFRVVLPDAAVSGPGTHEEARGARWLSGKGRLLSDLSGVDTHFLCIVTDITDRKKSEAALAETSHFLQAVIDTTPNLIFVVDAQGECILANRRAAEYYNATPGPDAPKQVQIADPGAHAFMKGSAQVIETGEPIASVEKQLASDGTSRWFHTIRVPLSRPDGTVAALGIAIDISGLKRAEESLQEKENHLRAILDAQPECVALTAADGVLLEINPAGLAMIEADTAEQVLGRNMFWLINQEDRVRFEELNRQVFEGNPFRIEFGIVGLKGAGRWLETHSTPLRDSRSNIIAALHVTRDITNRKKTETDLERAAARMMEAKSIAQLGSFSSDLVGGKIAFSPEVCRILGSAPGALLDGSDRMFHADAEQVRMAYRELIDDGTEMDVTFRWRRPAGPDERDSEIRHIHIRGSREQDADGKPKRIFGVIQDVTAHTQMVERLRQLTEHQEKVREEERTRIAREIHDELGQQLTGMKMRAAWTERLLSSSADTTNAIQARAELAAMSEALEATIRTVRRIASELRPPVLDALGLMPALEWLRGSFERDYGIACVTELDCGDVSPEAATTVFRVAQEALTNVARHAGATRVSVRLAERPDALVLDVEDNGRGLTAESVSRPGSFGLIGIRERARLSSGSVNLLKSDSGGVLLRLTLPNCALMKGVGLGERGR